MSGGDWRSRLRSETTAFFLDVDGTLLDFRDNPEDVVADGALRALLQRLQGAAGGALAMISGRMIADLDRIMAPLVLPAGGTHGAEIRFADGRIERVGQAGLDRLRIPITNFVAARSGLVVEDKGTAIAVHYRHAPVWASELTDFLTDVVSDHDLMVQHGKMVAEVKSSRSGKGSAIATLMQSPPFAGRTPLFIGDDLTDENGFERVNAMEGVAIKVGKGPTIAHRRLRDTGEVRDLLSKVCPASSASSPIERFT